MKPDHKEAAMYAQEQLNFYCPAVTADSNIAAAYLDLREKAKKIVDGVPDTWPPVIALREILEGK